MEKLSVLYAKNVPDRYKKYVQVKCIELNCDLTDYVSALIKRDMDKPLKADDVRAMEKEIGKVREV